MKLAIFSKILNDLPVDTLCPLLKEHGYDGVEWQVNASGHVHPDWVQEDARVAADAARRHGLESLCLSGYLKLYEPDAIEAQLAAAGSVGCPHVRIWPPAYRGATPYQQMLDESRRHLETITRAARSHGTRAVMEIHYGNIAPSVGLMYRLVEGFDPRDVGLIYDPDNFTREGMEHWQLGLELLGPYLAYVQFKSSAWVQAFDEGTAPIKATAGPAYNPRWRRAAASLEDGMMSWPAFLRILQRRGYDGYLSSEDGRQLAPAEKLAQNRASITRYWRQAEEGSGLTMPPAAASS